MTLLNSAKSSKQKELPSAKRHRRLNPHRVSITKNSQCRAEGHRAIGLCPTKHQQRDPLLRVYPLTYVTPLTCGAGPRVSRPIPIPFPDWDEIIPPPRSPSRRDRPHHRYLDVNYKKERGGSRARRLSPRGGAGDRDAVVTFLPRDLRRRGEREGKLESRRR
jgi:hypothetical protein